MTKLCYSELSKLQTFDERFMYLKLTGKVGLDTFGRDRNLNQYLYRSHEWKSLRDSVIIRDHGFDLGVFGYEIVDKAVVHHMNPITIEDVLEGNPDVMDPEFLITVSDGTHKAIHYGDSRLIPRLPVERRPGDTRLW